MSPQWVRRLWGERPLRLMAGDLAVLCLLGVATGALFAAPRAGGPATRALVEVSGKKVAVLDLARDAEQEVKGPHGITRLQVRGGRVRIAASPCPLGTCAHAGWIGAAGQVLVCLPNEVVVRIPAARAGDPDAVSR